MPVDIVIVVVIGLLLLCHGCLHCVCIPLDP